MTLYQRGFVRAGGDTTRTVVWIHGEHDVATKAALSLTLADAARLDGGDLLVDLSCVRFMDASTIGALIGARNRLRAVSRTLTIRNPSRLARRLFELCGLEGLIETPTRITHPVGSLSALSTGVAVAPVDQIDPGRVSTAPAVDTLAISNRRTSQPRQTSPARE
ncbi:MAG TPA: STAS domain-containing protein [Acidimicrobiales bacterium]|nr:STAS domain-containing protein [Acidimicrobiales bacterium]